MRTVVKVPSALTSQSPIRLSKWNAALDRAVAIQNANLTRSKARAASGVVDCLLLIQEQGLHTAAFIHLPAVSEWSDFDDCHGLCVFCQATVYVHLIVSESNNGEALSRARRLMPKRHNAKLCPFPIRQQIVNALANSAFEKRNLFEAPTYEAARTLGVPQPLS
jgi:hypothetical protein